MAPYNARISFSLDREGKKTRSFDVQARRYNDGAFVACLRAPSRNGEVLHRVEIEPQQLAQTRQLMRATSAQLRSSLAAGQPVSSVGHLWDIVGTIAASAPRAARSVYAGLPQSWDVVGFDLNSLRGELATRTAGFNPGSLGSSAGTGALAGLATGGVEGAARGALNAIGGAMGMSPETAEGIARGWAPTVDPSSFQARRDRALRELAAVIAAGTHPLGSANWLGAIRYHVGNAGITPAEGEALAANQAALLTFPAATPYPLNRDGTSAASAPAPLRMSAADALRAATQAPVIERAATLAALAQPLPGVAGESASAAAPAASAGASLGAAEILARALATLAAEAQGGADAHALADAANVARVALRTVDAIAGARVGDPRARAAIRDALNAGGARVARGLRVGLALAGG